MQKFIALSILVLFCVSCENDISIVTTSSSTSSSGGGGGCGSSLSITSVTRSKGTENGGQILVILGSGFPTDPSQAMVLLGDDTCTVKTDVTTANNTTFHNNTILCTTPDVSATTGTGARDVIVTNLTSGDCDTLSSGFEFIDYAVDSTNACDDTLDTSSGQFQNGVIGAAGGSCGDPLIVCNVEQYDYMLAQGNGVNGKYIRFGANIDFNSVAKTSIASGTFTTGPYFSGNMADDCNNTNDTEDANENVYLIDLDIYETNTYVGVIGYLNGGTFSNTNFINLEVKTDDDASWIGGIAGYYRQTGYIRYINMYGDTVISADSYTSTSGYTGGITGRHRGSTSNINNVTIDNLSLTNTNASQLIGGIAAYSTNTTNISDTHILAGTINANNSSDPTSGGTGGLFGTHDGGTLTITDSSFTGTITTTSGQNNGGIVGNSKNVANLTDVFASATITGGQRTGGLVGRQTSTLTITDSYFTGSLIEVEFNAGGLVGDVDSSTTITSSYATGTISETATTPTMGGVIGNFSAGALTLSKVYSTMTLTGGDRSGGMIGTHGTGTVSITDSYYSGAISGATDESGGLMGQGVPSLITLNRNYTAATVTDAVEIGGLIGDCNNSEFASFTDSFWDGDLNTVEACGVDGTATQNSLDDNNSKTTTDLKIGDDSGGSTFDGWPTATWDFSDTAAYPTFQ